MGTIRGYNMVAEFKVRSFSPERQDNEYTVTIPQWGEKKCTCPHFVERLQGTGETCKHIDTILSELEGGVEFAGMNKNTYDFIKFMQEYVEIWGKIKSVMGDYVPEDMLSPHALYRRINPVYFLVHNIPFTRSTLELSQLLNVRLPDEFHPGISMPFSL